MNSMLADLETRRLALQEKLDLQRNLTLRNRLGQFATPTKLAADIQRYARAQLSKNESVRFIDPAVGTGAFYSALMNEFPKSRIRSALGFEIDPQYGDAATKLWSKNGLEIRLADFTQSDAPANNENYNLLICNPPYVRHHHIPNSEKKRLKLRTLQACGVELSGLAGLYCYFLGLSHAWMSEGGLAGWLIPSEFMDVNYGVPLKTYLLNEVTLLHIHRFDPTDMQFGDALVSSSVVWFRKNLPKPDLKVRFTFGGTLEDPLEEQVIPAKDLQSNRKWSRIPLESNRNYSDCPALGDFFKIKRGIATGNNSYFILHLEDILQRNLPLDAFKPILPNPRYLLQDDVDGDGKGYPLLDRRLFLLDPPWTEDEIRSEYPALWNYFEEGVANGIAKRYLCRHRTPWYSQESRPPATFVCNYFGRIGTKRGKPFRFVLNNSSATASNVYTMLYPQKAIAEEFIKQPNLKRQIWEFLNRIPTTTMLSEGRVYGGGLYKLEPKELANVRADEICELLPKHLLNGRSL